MVYHDASIYLVMNFTRRTLMKVLEDSFLSVDEVRSYLTQILAAVAFLHANDIIHANLAPSHILVGQRNLTCHFRVGKNFNTKFCKLL